MRASGSGPFGVILMITPLLAVPVLAIVGIPQFAPVVASPASATELSSAWDEAIVPESRVGESARSTAEDLFAPLAGNEAAELAAIHQPARSRQSGRLAGKPNLDDDFARAFEQEVGSQSARRDWQPPSEALGGWAVENIGNERRQPKPRTAAAPRKNSSAATEFDDFNFEQPARETPTVPSDLEDGERAEEKPPQLTWISAQRRLKELGVGKSGFTYLKERQTFRFSCQVTDGNSTRPRGFAAEADELLIAVEDVLRQIEAAN